MPPLGDHIPVTWQHHIRQQGTDTITILKQVEKLGPPTPITSSTWRHILDTTWKQHFHYDTQATTPDITWTQPYIDLIQTGNIDEAWHTLQQHLEKALLQATLQAYNQANIPRKSHDTRPRGALQFHSTTSTTRKPHNKQNYTEQRLWRRSARLNEALRHSTDTLTKSPSHTGLRRKLSQITTSLDHETLTTLLHDTTNELRNYDAAQSRLRLQNWRNKLLNDHKQTYKWLRNAQPTQTRHIASTKHPDLTSQHAVTTTTHAALQHITAYWRNIWRRPLPDEAQAKHTATSSIGPARTPQTWQPLTYTDLATAAKQQAHKAPGMDGWHGDDIALLPAHVWPGLAHIINHMEQLEQTPIAWTQSRQAHKPKDASHPSEYTTPDRLRPLSIASTWYRTWAAARLHTTATKQWIGTWIHPNTYGGRQHITATHAAAAVLNNSHNGYIATLDLRQAFDHLTPETGIHTLRHLGLPTHTANFIQNVWTRQHRYLTYDQHTATTPELVYTSTPQGDSWSMLALNACLQSALHDIQAHWPQTTTSLYVDDRTFTSPTLQEPHQVNQYWHTYTAAIGIPENHSKAQYWSDGDTNRRQEIADAFGYTYDPLKHDHISFLGITLAPTGTTPCSYKEPQLQNRRRRPPQNIQHEPASPRALQPPSPHHHHSDDIHSNQPHIATHMHGGAKATNTHKRTLKRRKAAPPPQQSQPTRNNSPQHTQSTQSINPSPPRTRRRKPENNTAQDHEGLYPREAERIQAARATLNRIQRLPHGWRQRAHYIAATALPKASYGWLHHLPSATTCTKFRVDTYKALGTPYTCDRALARIFAGHNTDIAFMAGYTLATSYHKQQQTNRPLHIQPTLSETNLAQWYINQGWQPQPQTPYTWHHQASNITTQGPLHHDHIQNNPSPPHPLWPQAHDTSAAHAHKLREAWRVTQYNTWASSTRVDAAEAQSPPYDSKRIQHARQAIHHSPHHFSIMTGGVVSTARYVVMKTNTPGHLIPHEHKQCPNCPEVGNWTHMVWECPANPPPIPPPTDLLQRRHGWPRTSTTPADKQYDTAVLQHLVKTRTELLQSRYDTKTESQHNHTSLPPERE